MKINRMLLIGGCGVALATLLTAQVPADMTGEKFRPPVLPDAQGTLDDPAIALDLHNDQLCCVSREGLTKAGWGWYTWGGIPVRCRTTNGKADCVTGQP